MKLTQHEERNPRPGRTITLHPWVFADQWSGKPSEPVEAGLRLLSNADLDLLKARASAKANELHRDFRTPDDVTQWVETYNDVLVRQGAALGLCHLTSVNKAMDVMRLAEDQVDYALTAKGAVWIWEQIERYAIESSSIDPLLMDSEVDEFCATLKANTAKLLPSHRKLLAHVLSALL